MSDVELLERPISDRATIEATYLDAIVREGVFPAGAFQLALPRLWTTQTAGAGVVPGPEMPVATIARFRPGAPNAAGAAIEAGVDVWAAWLPRVINGSDWLRRWCVTQGHEIQAIRELPTPNGLMGDAVAISRATGRLHRLVTMKDGDLIFLVDGSVRTMGVPDAPQLQEIPLMAAIRFRLLEPSGQRYAEPMVETAISAGPVDASFLLPQSWDVEDAPDRPPGGAAKVMRSRLGELVTGTLVVALSPGSLDAEALESMLVAKLGHQGYGIDEGALVLRGTRGQADFSLVQRQGRFQGQDLRLLCLRANGQAMSRGARGALSAVMISPAAASAFEAWANNRRVFEIILETFTLDAGG